MIDAELHGPVVDWGQMARLDRSMQERYGVSAEALMEVAGARCADALWRANGGSAPRSVIVVAGGGHNGGDALVTARHARARGAPVTVVAVGEPRSPLVATQLARAERLGCTIARWPDVAAERLLAAAEEGDGTWIVEGLTGNGLSSAARPELATLIAAVNASAAPVLSIDLPGGAWEEHGAADALVCATVTAVTGPLRRAHLHPRVRASCGRLVASDPGFAADLVSEIAAAAPFRLVGDVEARLDACPAPAADVHKYRRGVVAVIGGDRGYEGAAALSGAGALAAGAGVAIVYAGSGAVRTGAAALMWREMPTDATRPAAWSSILERVSAVVAGPGWIAAHPAAVAALLAACGDAGVPVVVDAAAIAHMPDGDRRTAPRVVTPHPGEMGLLIDWPTDDVLSRPWEALERARKRTDATVLLKGPVTFVRDDDGMVAVDGCQPALATAGSGDVLAGLIGGLLARGCPLAVAVRRAVVDHRAAGSLRTAPWWPLADEIARAATGSGGAAE